MIFEVRSYTAKFTHFFHSVCVIDEHLFHDLSCCELFNHGLLQINALKITCASGLRREEVRIRYWRASTAANQDGRQPCAHCSHERRFSLPAASAANRMWPRILVGAVCPASVKV